MSHDDLFGFGGNNPAVWGAAAGISVQAGASAAIRRGYVTSPTIVQHAELAAGGAGALLAAALAYFKPEHRDLAVAMGVTSVLSGAIRTLEKKLLPATAPITKTEAVAGLGYASISKTNTLGYPTIQRTHSLGLPSIENTQSLGRAQLVGNNSGAQLVGDGAQLVGGPKLDGLGASYGSTLFSKD